MAGCIGESEDEADPGADDEENGEEENGDDVDEETDQEVNEDSTIHFTQEQSRGEDFDPIVSNDAYSAQVYGWVFDSLYTWDEGLDLVPKVATDFPDIENDGTRFIFEIHEGIEFHNGDEMTAEDVEHAFVAPVEEETDNATSYDMIEDTEVIDDYQLQVDLEEPYGPFEMQTMAVTIPNMEARLEDPDEYNENPIGSGPFQIAEFEYGEEVVLERWDDYWDDPQPNLQQITYVAHDDDAGRISDIRAGNTDIVTGIPEDDWEVLEGEDGVEPHLSESPSYMYLAFNCQDGGTADPNVRRAIGHAFSMSDFVESNLDHTSDPMSSIVPPTVNEVWDLPAEEYEDLLPEYDPEMAEELLDEYAPDDYEPTIITPEGSRAQLAERIATRLDEIGYGANVNVLDFDTLIDTYTSGDADDYEMYLLGWTGGPDPDFYAYPLFHESGHGVNNGHFYEGSDDFHDNIAAARASADRDERYELYDEIIREINEELPALAAFSQHNTSATLETVHDHHPHPNVQTNPRWVSDYNNVWVE